MGQRVQRRGVGGKLVQNGGDQAVRNWWSFIVQQHSECTVYTQGYAEHTGTELRSWKQISSEISWIYLGYLSYPYNNLSLEFCQLKKKIFGY
jgi:hypothetical protein